MMISCPTWGEDGRKIILSSPLQLKERASGLNPEPAPGLEPRPGIGRSPLDPPAPGVPDAPPRGGPKGGTNSSPGNAVAWGVGVIVDACGRDGWS
ncbi:MAG: hypothetical protein HW403_1438 [Dehalococcoidia bacterium]|nr:hypothetical protein [Dehalococcoidia bacterium]